MPRSMTASDRKALIRLASTLAPGSDGRRVLLATLSREARVKSKSESMRMLKDLQGKHGGRTKAYYEAVLDEVRAGVIAPSAVVGGGYKDGKKVAIKWLEDQIKSAPAKTAAGEWIEDAIKEPGRLHRYFGIPEDENIPMSKIDAEIAKIKKKDDRTKEDTSLLRALNLAKTLKSKD